LKSAETKPSYVGFWVRCAATLIDTVCLLAVTTPMMVLMGERQASSVAESPLHPPSLRTLHGLWTLLLSGQPPDSLQAGLVSYGIPALVVLAFWRYKHATPGKMMFSAVIVDAKTLRPAGTHQLLVRYVTYFLAAMPLGLGLLWVAFDPRKQGWHDKLAGTVVIRR